MPKKSTAIVPVEVLPPAGRTASGQDRFDQLVQQKVAEILADRESLLLEPFFRSRQVAYEIRRLQSVPEKRRWTVFYERHGCLCCRDTQALHAGNGMCQRCRSGVLLKLNRIVKELSEGGEDARSDLR